MIKTAEVTVAREFALEAERRADSRELVLYQPQNAAENLAKADALLAFATRVKDWPLLEQAVDAKIAEQEEFCDWWRDHVSVRHGLNRHNQENASGSSLSVDAAEEATGIAQQQVSRWRKRLKDRDAYRQSLIDAARRKAMAERAPSDTPAKAGSASPAELTPIQRASKLQAAWNALSFEEQERFLELNGLQRKATLIVNEERREAAVPSPTPAAAEASQVDTPPVDEETAAGNKPIPPVQGRFVLRPWCLNVDDCSGYGREHCGTCARAARAKGAQVEAA